ncbi:hypothetical protein OGAPHI_003143 [Ogataea philodendri]|uniref:Uncharacterized protein n=1 Tax=Ogataea philodendri TaxID=1378263 RepID=A0A9P8P9P7_9ASCO|nr:uncharacterized protein OGAPHI_003143 [Ogataea philodendri]KAH3667494.1 hypothetical protein OGAPHI_003143 [Ogataea philodendri]
MLKPTTLKAGSLPRYFDVAVNLCDDMFMGKYRDRVHHEADMDTVLRRSRALNVDRILLTGSSLKESRWSAEQVLRVNKLPDAVQYPHLYTTIGVHPCSVLEFEPDPKTHLGKLRELVARSVADGSVRAFGEIGLDYDRLQHAPADKQRAYFELQLKLATEFELPLFLHMRNALDDFLEILVPFLEGTRADGLALKNRKVLVHSFTGTQKELDRLLGYPSVFLSVNGCSLRTEENCQVVARIPLDRLLIETDSPWCEIKRTHHSYQFLTRAPNACYPFEYTVPEQTASKKAPRINYNEFLPLPVVRSEKYSAQVAAGAQPLVKSRNEPGLIGQVAEIVAALHETDPEHVVARCYANSLRWLDLS